MVVLKMNSVCFYSNDDQPENLFYRITCSESDSMSVSLDVWLEFFNSLVCGIGTKHLGKEIISERENCCI